jgi:hypothetical protein
MLLLAVGVAASAAVGLHAAAGSARVACEPLRLGSGPGWSEKTGQHSATFVVTNASGRRCTFDGYPRVVLLDRGGRVLHFTFHRGGDQMITARLPRPVVVKPGGRVYFAINKYRCDVRSKALATAIKVQLPGSPTWLRLALPAYPLLDFCGSAAPSGLVTISPVVAALQDAAARP